MRCPSTAKGTRIRGAFNKCIAWRVRASLTDGNVTVLYNWLQYLQTTYVHITGLINSS